MPEKDGKRSLQVLETRTKISLRTTKIENTEFEKRLSRC
jgi:hypothetical protein